MLSSPSLNAAFTANFTREFCESLFRTKTEKIWNSWNKFHKGNVSALYGALNNDNKRRFLQWMYTNSVNIVRDHGLARPEYDPNRLAEIQGGFTKEVCDMIFQQKSDNVWNVWQTCGKDAMKFLTNLYVYDKYAIILYFD